jgi:hypothetical protein
MNWISIEDLFPPEGEIVLCCDKHNEFVTIGRMNMDEDGQQGCFELMWIEEVQLDAQITHWMPRPKPARG